MKPDEFLPQVEDSRYVVLLSACVSNDYHHHYLNQVHTKELQSQLQAWGLYFFEVEGCYQGKTEPSFVVLCNTFYYVARLMHQGFNTYHQESVIVLDNQDSSACLIFADVFNVSPDVIGARLMLTDEKEAKQQGSYTMFDSRYYIVG